MLQQASPIQTSSITASVVAHPARDASDRRRAERHMPVGWQGTLEVESQDHLLSCAILDVTAQGARVTIREALRLPKVVRLHLNRDGATMNATVAWQLGFDAGLSFFEEPVSHPQAA